MIRLVKKYLWIIPIVIFAIIIVRGATLHSLWGDEAETAFYAKTINVRGLPYAFDGVNVTSLAGGAALNTQLVNHVNPWLPFYLTAWSFRLLGKSSFAARLPFLLFSIASIPLLYFLTFRLTKRRITGLFACGIAVTSVPFILFSYNARYYSLIIFFGLAMLYTALRLTERSVWPKICFVIAFTGNLYSQYVSAVILFTSLFFGLAVYFRSEKKPWKYVITTVILYAGLGALSVLSFMPWFWANRPYISPSGIIFSPLNDIIGLLPYWIEITVHFYNSYNIFPYIFALLAAVVFAVRVRHKKDFSELTYVGATLLLYVLIVAGLSAYVLTGSTFFTEIRYNLILMPMFFIVVAISLVELWRWNRWVGGIVAVVYLSTNLFTFTPFRSLPLEYAGEWLHPYTASNEVVAAYLQSHAKNGDTAFVNSDRAHEPLIFLLGTKLKFVNRISPENRAVFPANYSVLPKYTYVFVEPPDWVILYSAHSLNDSVYDFDLRGTYPLGLFPTVDLMRDYTRTILPVFYGPDETRPELEFHLFSSPEPSNDEQIFIYHKNK